MANSTLTMMQAIEEEAQAVLEQYESDISGFKEQAQRELDDLSQAYDRETDLEVATVQERAHSDLEQLRQDIEATIARNEGAVREALTDKKDDLVKAIVDKVVASYGY